MTRVRILEGAKRLLLAGYLPHGKITCTDIHDNPVSVSHPDAAKFTLFSAIERAIFNQTGSPPFERIALYEAATEPVINYLGGDTIEAFEKMRTMSQEQTLKMINNILKSWEPK